MAERDYEVVRLTPEHLDGAIKVLHKAFMPAGMIPRCLDILTDSEVVEDHGDYVVTKATKDCELLCVEMAKEGVSFVAINKETGEYVGSVFNKIQMKAKPGEVSYFEEFVNQKLKDPLAKKYITMLSVIDDTLSLFDHYKIDSLMEISFLGTVNAHKGKGIGEAIMKASIDLAQKMKDANSDPNSKIDVISEAKGFGNSPALKVAPKVASAVFSSFISRRIGGRLGMEHLAEFPYSDFEHKGRKFSEVVGPDHPCVTLSGLLLK